MLEVKELKENGSLEMLTEIAEKLDSSNDGQKLISEWFNDWLRKKDHPSLYYIDFI